MTMNQASLFHSSSLRPAPRPLPGGRAALLALALCCANAHAASYTWTPLTAGPFNWDNTGPQNNWGTGSGGLFPNAIGDVANVVRNISAAQTINLNQAITVGSLTIGDSASTYYATTIEATGGSLTFDNGGSTAILTRTGPNNNSTVQINAPVTVVGTLEISVGANGSINLDGKLSGDNAAVIQTTGLAGNARSLRIRGDISGFEGTFKHTQNVAGTTDGPRFTGATPESNDGSKASFEFNGATAFVSNHGANTNVASVDGAVFKMGRLSGSGGVLEATPEGTTASMTLEVGHLNTNSAWNGVFVSQLATQTANFTKVGDGILDLGGNNLYNGVTNVNGGTLLVNGTHATGSTYTVASAGTLGGDGTINATVDVSGAISPGGSVTGDVFADSAAKLIVYGPVTLEENSAYRWDIANWTGEEPGTDWDFLDASELILEGTIDDKITITISGWPANFSESPKTFDIALSYDTAISGFDVDAIGIDDSAFGGTGTWAVQVGINLDLVEVLQLVYAPGPGTPYTDWAILKGLSGPKAAPGEDADGDGLDNLTEFALDGDPLSGANDGKVVGKVAEVGGDSVLTLTLPVRTGATFSGDPAQESGAVDGVVYRIEASENLVDWDVEVSEVTGGDATTIQTGLPALTSGEWEYRTFRVQGKVPDSPKRFIRAVIEAETLEME